MKKEYIYFLAGCTGLVASNYICAKEAQKKELKIIKKYKWTILSDIITVSLFGMSLNTVTTRCNDLQNIVNALACSSMAMANKEPINDTIICYDETYNRFFEIKKEELIRAEYYLNKSFCKYRSVSLNEFYALLGLPTIEIGKYYGWSKEDGLRRGYDWINIRHIPIRLSNGVKIYLLQYNNAPSEEY